MPGADWPQEGYRPTRIEGAAMLPAIPFWMRQRQIKIEPINETTVAIKTPNLPTHELSLRPGENGTGYVAAIHCLPAAGGEKFLVAEKPSGLSEPQTAWQFAFELFRQKVIV
jgi:hypothetical protein